MKTSTFIWKQAISMIIPEILLEKGSIDEQKIIFFYSVHCKVHIFISSADKIWRFNIKYKPLKLLNRL